MNGQSSIKPVESLRASQLANVTVRSESESLKSSYQQTLTVVLQQQLLQNFTFCMNNFTNSMERIPGRNRNQRRRRNREAGRQTVSSSQEDEVTRLRRENAQLKVELNDAQYFVHVNYLSWVDSEKRAKDLSSRLEKANVDLFNERKKVERLKMEAQQRRNQQSIHPPQRSADAFISAAELDQLVTVVTDAHDWITYGWEPSDDEEKAENEYQESLGKLKGGLIDLTEKLQQEQRALIKEAYRHGSCTTEKGGHCKKHPNEQAEVEKVNLRIQTLQLDLLKQAMSVRYSAKKPPQKTYQEKWQQTDEPQAQEDHNETWVSSVAQLDQEDVSETCSSSIAELDQEDISESCASSMAELDQEDLSETWSSSMSELDQEDMSQTCSSSTAELDQEGLNETCSSSIAQEDPAADQRLEERLQWQQEGQCPGDILRSLRETKETNMKELAEKERKMANRMDELESRIEDMLEEKARKKKSWFKRLFSCFRS